MSKIETGDLETRKIVVSEENESADVVRRILRLSAKIQKIVNSILDPNVDFEELNDTDFNDVSVIVRGIKSMTGERFDDLSQRTGVSRATLSRAARNERNMDLENIIRVLRSAARLFELSEKD